MMDANADHSDPLFSKFLEDCSLLDLHDNPTGILPPATYFRGSKRIDFILGSFNIAMSVSKRGILDYSSGLKFSDHRALFVDLSELAVFGSNGKITPPTRQVRGLRASNKTQVTNYCRIFRLKLYSQNILNCCWGLRRIGEQQGLDAMRDELEKIDQFITAAALKTAKQCSRKPYGYPWSPQLANAGRTVTFWRNCLWSARTGANPGQFLIPSQLKGS